MLPICPECAQGKHQNCDGDAEMDINGNYIPCGCQEGKHPRRVERFTL